MNSKHKAPPLLTAVAARWVLPVHPINEVLENHCIVFENDTIVDVIPIEHISVSYPNANLIKRPNHVLMPGLINSHTHSSMSLMRGIADDLPLMEWLNNHIWPKEAEFINPSFIKDGANLAIAEMLLSGTTCFNDMYFFPDVVAKAAQTAGIRATVGLIIIDFPTQWAQDSNEYFKKAASVHDLCRNMPLISTAMAPHAPYTVNDDNLVQARILADELTIPVHMHVHETAFEVAEAERLGGKRPLQRLHELGLLNAKLMAIHMTQLNDDEIQTIAEHGVSVVHCPESNLKLNSGFCPVQRLMDVGINVALGTDGAASNNDLDMLGEIQTAALIAKPIADDATALPAHIAIEMATINGAKALNMDETIGSLEVGKQADMITIDLNHVSTQPTYDPIASVVYSATRQQVSDTWVAGQHLVKDHQLTQMDHNELTLSARHWHDKLAASESSN